MNDQQEAAPLCWCHRCIRAVQPTREDGEIRCPDCNTGFIQELQGEDAPSEIAAEGAASLWYSVLFDMLEGSNSHRHETAHGSTSGTRETSRPANTLVRDRRSERNFDLLLRMLVESETTRTGTPPAQREAVEGLPTVRVAERSNCPVCLEDMAIGSQAKEMPCKHRFHMGCIVPWLEIHGTCPVCRMELKVDACRGSSSGGGGGDREGRRRGQRLPSCLAGLFSRLSRRRRRRQLRRNEGTLIEC